MNLTINLVTRGRPERLLHTIEQTLPNIALDTTKLLVSVDDDDQPTIDALSHLPRDKRIIPVIRPREDALGAKWNRAMLYPADVYMPMGDYTPVMTPGFDRVILDANVFPDGIGAIYSQMANLSFPSIWCVTHGLASRLGWMCPPYFPYWFVDHWVDDIAKLIDRISFADIQISVFEKPQTQEVREVAFWSTLFDSQRLVRRKQARDIIDSPTFMEPEWRKDILRKHYPLVEYKSQWVNDMVRSWPSSAWAEKAVTDGGGRYDRLRSKAVDMIADQLPAIEADMRVAA